MPTPVRNPTSTVREMKLARKPSRAIRERKRNPAARSALRLAKASHWGVYGFSPAIPSDAIPAYMIAAVAESPPTTRWRDEPSSANARIGIRIVYSPVITGVPGDLRVAHHLRDRERGERDAGDDVAREPRPLVRADAPEDGHRAHPGMVES